jgi:hypothetical protein
MRLVRNSYRAYCASKTLEVACPVFITLILSFGFVRVIDNVLKG